MSRKKIAKVAEVARKAFETNSISRKLLIKLYSHYNPDVEINSFLDDAAKLFPAMNCGLASVYLQHKLHQGEIVYGSYDGHNHAFLSLGETIIDITADQFGGPKVYVGPPEKPWSLS
jgi:hypothetical protein